MGTNNTNGKKKFLALLLSVMMVSTGAAAFASCTKDSDTDSSSSSSSTETSTPKDTGLITNAGFETFNTNDGLNLIGTSTTGWTRSVNSATSGSAVSSKAASGIIDTADAAWNNLTTSKLGDLKAAELTEAQAKSNWSKMTAKDKLEYREAWEDENDDKDDDFKKLSFYDSKKDAFNIDADDLPETANPRTHDYKEGETAENTNVLMLHNEYSSGSYNNFGTAQKYTSSSTVKIPAGSKASFSVWVKTSDLTMTSTSGAVQEAVNRGAYIRVTHTLGGTTLDPLEIKNINTAGVTDNNGWVKYSFFLESSTFADSTFTIVLGLGQSGGTDRSEYVNGYAFFDDLTCELDGANYDADKKAAKPVSLAHDTKAEKKIFDAATNGTAYALDFASTATSKPWDVLSGWNCAPTTEERSGKEYTAAANPKANGVTTYSGLGIDTTEDLTGVFKVSDLAKKGDYAKAVYEKNFDGKSAIVSDKDSVLMLLSANGAAYTATSAKTNYELKADGYMAISFYVKTSYVNGLTGAGISLIDGTAKTTISNIDTTTSEQKNEDGTLVDDGWLKCMYFVHNGTSEARTFSLSFTYGPTTVVDTKLSSYYTGFAAFANFEIYTFQDSTEYDYATSSTYTKVVTLTANDSSAAGDSGFDTPANVPTGAIEKGYAVPKSYFGVYSDNDYVTLDGNGKNAEKNVHLDEEKNYGISAGLLSSKYLTVDDKDNASYSAILSKLGAKGDTAQNKWDALFNKNSAAPTTQPLVIYNDKVQTKSYGFLGAKTAIAANTYTAVSLRVMTNATAYVYLTDMDDDNHGQLNVTRNRTYWYDDDGNICAKDPTDHDFNPAKDVAFKLQPNGLYKVNAAWNTANEAGCNANAYYANLSAYNNTDDEGNLLVADGGVSYDYDQSKWINDGNDGIAFYKKGEDFYADSKHTVKVQNLASVAKLEARYEATASDGLFFEIKNTNGAWATVSFYIHTGDEAKNYRLEVWSGSRDSKTVNKKAGDFVVFDSYNAGTIDEAYATLVADRKAEIEANEKLGNYFDGVFSFYDSAKFLRYNETIDVDGVKNSYTSYLSSAYTDSVAYLKYQNAGIYETFADYALSETAVTADVDDDTSNDTSDETTTTTNSADGWLLASSIAIAAVLVFAVVSIIVRKVILKNRKNRGAESLANKSKK